VEGVLESFTSDTFAGRVGETFRVTTPDGRSFDTTLVEAEVCGPARSRFRVPFSLLFRGPLDVLVPQGTYRIEHDELGHFELFIVPVGPDDEGMCYEAIFA
jgi:hypothetical protein